MEQPCYKCGQTVEEGWIFCPHCAAPQIRVLVAEPAVALPQAVSPSRVEATLPPSQTVPVLALPMQWSTALKPCALAAVVASLLMFLGLHPFVAMPSAGFLAVVFYRRGQAVAIKLGTAVRFGAFSGLLYFGLTAVLTALASITPELRAKLREQILENIQKWSTAYPDDPRVQQMLRDLKTPEGFIMWVILGGVMLLIVSIVLAGLGGAVGGMIFRRRNRE